MTTISAPEGYWLINPESNIIKSQFEIDDFDSADNYKQISNEEADKIINSWKEFGYEVEEYTTKTTSTPGIVGIMPTTKGVVILPLPRPVEKPVKK